MTAPNADYVPPPPFAAAELAMERAMESEEVKGAQKLESILGGNGEYTSEVAFQVWQTEMANLGFAEYANEAPQRNRKEQGQ